MTAHRFHTSKPCAWVQPRNPCGRHDVFKLERPEGEPSLAKGIAAVLGIFLIIAIAALVLPA